MTVELTQWLASTPAAWLMVWTYAAFFFGTVGVFFCVGTMAGRLLTMLIGGFALAFALDLFIVAWAAAVSGIVFHIAGVSFVAYLGDPES